jgi:hypothetical protein
MELTLPGEAIRTRETSLAGSLCSLSGFLLAFRGAITFLFFRSSPQAGAGATVALTLIWALFVAESAFMAPPKQDCSEERGKPSRWLLLYLVLAGVSLTWTTTYSVGVASAYWAAVVADVATVWLLLRYPSVQENVAGIMKGFVAGAAAVAIIAWIVPPMDDMRLGHEDFLHPNFIGFEFAIAALFCAYFARSAPHLRSPRCAR